MTDVQKKPGARNTGPMGGTGIPENAQVHYTTEPLKKQEKIRIDFAVTDSGVRVTKYFRVKGHDRIFADELKDPWFDLDGALAWCEENGYTVRRWPAGCGFLGGARAFKPAPWPIRSKREIWNVRKRVEAQVSAWIERNPGLSTPGLTFLDFAVDM
jgi:hypothetical protein